MILDASQVVFDPSEIIEFRPTQTSKPVSFLKIKNLSENKVSFKVKTSAPKEFLVTPISGSIFSLEEVKISITFIGTDDRKNQGQKFAIDYFLADAGEGTNLAQVKLLTNFLAEDSEKQEDRKEESEVKHDIGGSFYDEPKLLEEKKEGDERRDIHRKNSEIIGDIERLKAKIEKANHRLKFSKDIDLISQDIGGKYAIPHLVLMFVVGLLIGYYILA